MWNAYLKLGTQHFSLNASYYFTEVVIKLVF